MEWNWLKTELPNATSLKMTSEDKLSTYNAEDSIEGMDYNQ